MAHRLEFDLGLHRLTAAADGGGSRDYPDFYGSSCISVGLMGLCNKYADITPEVW